MGMENSFHNHLKPCPNITKHRNQPKMNSLLNGYVRIFQTVNDCTSVPLYSIGICFYCPQQCVQGYIPSNKNNNNKNNNYNNNNNSKDHEKFVDFRLILLNTYSSNNPSQPQF